MMRRVCICVRIIVIKFFILIVKIFDWGRVVAYMDDLDCCDGRSVE